MRLGIARLLSRHPLLGGIVNSWDITEYEPIRTMGIGFDEAQGWRLYYAPSFVRPLPLDQLTGVLLHEARHVLYDHCFQKEEQFPDQIALVIAQETTVNENIDEPLPPGGLLLEQFPNLPKNESTEERYRRLAIPIPPPKDPPPISPSNSPKDPPGAGQEGDPTGKQPGPGEKHQGQSPPSTLDNHDRWGEIKAQESDAKAQLASTLEAIMKSNPILSDFEQATIEEASNECGSQPGSFVSLLKRLRSRHPINWKRVLRRFVGRDLCRRPSLRRPPRRFPEMVGIFAGSDTGSGKPRLMCVLDTSGSMTDEILAELSAELLRLSKTHRVTMVECDMTIHRVYAMKGPIKAVHGRGGTSFCPPFEKAFLKKMKPDAIVYLTDGYGNAPKAAPRVPVLWLLTESTTRPAKWGKVAYLPQASSQTG